MVQKTFLMRTADKTVTFLNAAKEFIIYYGAGIYNRFDKGHVFLIAGGLSFSILTCMVPFILIVFSILGRILAIPNVQDQIRIFLETAIPYDQASELVKQVVFSRVYEFQLFKSEAGYLGAVGILIAASGLFSSMRTVLNDIYGVSKDKHAIVGKLRDFAMVLIVILFFFLSISVLPILEVVKDSIGSIGLFETLRLTQLQKLLISAISVLIMFTVFYVLYTFISYEKLPKKVVAVSAFWATMLWEFAKQLFGYYITHFATLNRVYGTYIFVVILGFWIYYSSIVFILSAHIGQLFRERWHDDRNSPGSEGEADEGGIVNG